jgi:hypothetical protein
MAMLKPPVLMPHAPNIDRISQGPAAASSSQQWRAKLLGGMGQR